MSNGMEESAGSQRTIGRSILALLAGFLVTVVLSLTADLGMHAAGFFPSPGQPMNDTQLLAATVYRTLFSVLSSYVTARLAPYGPMAHALIGGAIGTLLATGGAVTTWNKGLGPHWYPLALIVTALPSAWLGGKLRALQLQKQPA